MMTQLHSLEDTVDFFFEVYAIFHPIFSILFMRINSLCIYCVAIAMLFSVYSLETSLVLYKINFSQT